MMSERIQLISFGKSKNKNNSTGNRFVGSYPTIVGFSSTSRQPQAGAVGKEIDLGH